MEPSSGLEACLFVRKQLHGGHCVANTVSRAHDFWLCLITHL